MGIDFAIGDNIKKLRKSWGLTQAELGNKLGIRQSYIVALEKGRRKPSYEMLSKIAKTFSVDVGWLLTGEEKIKEIALITDSHPEYITGKKLTAVPIVNVVSAGYGKPIFDDNIRTYVYLPNLPHPKVFGLVVDGESMIPDLYPDDVVVVDPAIRTLVPNNLGIFWYDGKGIIKRYIPFPDGGGCVLQSSNPRVPPIVITKEADCIIVGKIIYKILKCK